MQIDFHIENVQKCGTFNMMHWKQFLTFKKHKKRQLLLAENRKSM